MAEALLSLHGCHCISLGVALPLRDLATAALTEGDIVALSFSEATATAQAAAALHELRRLLPEGSPVRAGGSSPALHRRMLPGVPPVVHIALVGTLADGRRQAGNGSAP